MRINKESMVIRSGDINQDLSSEIDSWVLREAELHGAFESFPRDSLEKILNETVQKTDGNLKILDLGCGTGFFSYEIAELGHKVYGIDASRQMINYAKEKKKGVFRFVPFILGNIESLPFKEESFDACFCGVILHHFHDIKKISQEMFRVLKRGGFIFGVENNIRNWHVFLSMSPSSPLRYDKNTPNERAISPDELVRVFKKDLGMELNIVFRFLKMPHEGKQNFWDLPVIYKLFGFVVKKMRGFHKRLLGILVFNIVHIIQIFQPIEKKANFLIFRAKKTNAVVKKESSNCEQSL